MNQILIAFEESGRVREAFRRRGYDAISCDLRPSLLPGPHIQGDVMPLLQDRRWALIIAFPPCTYLCVSGVHWNNRIPGRAERSAAALDVVRAVLDANSERIALENPVGIISRHIRPPDQWIQPWQFGHPESKKTGLHLVNLPPLRPTCILTPTAFQVNGRPRWENQTPTGQNRLSPSADRARRRGWTQPGIADAMADQWGMLL